MDPSNVGSAVILQLKYKASHTIDEKALWRGPADGYCFAVTITDVCLDVKIDDESEISGILSGQLLNIVYLSTFWGCI